MMPADTDDTTTRVWRLLTENLHLDVPSLDTDLIETGVLDSLALVELLFQIERQLGVTISLDAMDLEGFRSVRAMGAMLHGQLAVQGQPPAP